MTEFKSRHEQQPHPIEEELQEARALLRERLDAKHSQMTGCTSYLQRKLQCGYNHAAILIELMVDRGWVSQADERGARTIF